MRTDALPRPALADALLGRSTAAVDAALVAGGVLAVALLAQVRIPLGFTPVPVTGQTFGVVLVGATLGPSRGALSLLLYVLSGAVGLPFFAGGQGGPEHVWGATGGYLVGFVAAAALAGALARRGLDRRPLHAFLAFQAASLVIFAFGVTGLALALDVGFGEALRLGWLPFVPGDLLKTAVAAGLFPVAWLAVRRIRPS